MFSCFFFILLLFSLLVLPSRCPFAHSFLFLGGPRWFWSCFLYVYTLRGMLECCIFWIPSITPRNHAVAVRMDCSDIIVPSWLALLFTFLLFFSIFPFFTPKAFMVNTQQHRSLAQLPAWLYVHNAADPAAEHTVNPRVRVSLRSDRSRAFRSAIRHERNMKLCLRHEICVRKKVR